MVGEDSKPERMSSELAGTHFTIGKKNSDEISGVQRSGIKIIAEFRGIPSRFPNQAGTWPLSIFYLTLHPTLGKNTHQKKGAEKNIS
jgi:hypothetical protein